MLTELPPLALPGVRLRPAVDADEPFLRRLYRSVRDPELALTGWPPEAKQAFSDSQFDLQARHYHAYYPGAFFGLIEREEVAIGRIYLDLGPGSLRLMDLAFLPGERDRGLGSAFMRWLGLWADREQRETGLFVESGNPAKRLYERHGFSDAGLDGLNMRMRRLPATPG